MNTFRSPLKVFLILVLAGQLLFALGSRFYTAPHFEGRIFATLGAQWAGASNLHELNDAAHYFGQTIIGWTKFPHFLSELQEKAKLPASAGFSAHLQERQNIVFTLTGSAPFTEEQLAATLKFVQAKMNEYNAMTHTGFTLSNTDEELVETTRAYVSGALLTGILSLVLACGFLYLSPVPRPY